MKSERLKMKDLLGIEDELGHRNLIQLHDAIKAAIRGHINDRLLADKIRDPHPQPEMRVIFCCFVEALAWADAVDMPHMALQDLLKVMCQSSVAEAEAEKAQEEW